MPFKVITSLVELLGLGVVLTRLVFVAVADNLGVELLGVFEQSALVGVVGAVVSATALDICAFLDTADRLSAHWTLEKGDWVFHFSSDFLHHIVYFLTLADIYLVHCFNELALRPGPAVLALVTLVTVDTGQGKASPLEVDASAGRTDVIGGEQVVVQDVVGDKGFQSLENEVQSLDVLAVILDHMPDGVLVSEETLLPEVGRVVHLAFVAKHLGQIIKAVRGEPGTLGDLVGVQALDRGRGGQAVGDQPCFQKRPIELVAIVGDLGIGLFHYLHKLFADETVIVDILFKAFRVVQNRDGRNLLFPEPLVGDTDDVGVNQNVGVVDVLLIDSEGQGLEKRGLQVPEKNFWLNHFCGHYLLSHKPSNDGQVEGFRHFLVGNHQLQSVVAVPAQVEDGRVLLFVKVSLGVNVVSC
jgi:hypothetical protein